MVNMAAEVRSYGIPLYFCFWLRIPQFMSVVDRLIAGRIVRDRFIAPLLVSKISDWFCFFILFPLKLIYSSSEFLQISL